MKPSRLAPTKTDAVTLRPRHPGNLRCARALRTPNEGPIERDKDRAGRPAAQMHRVSEFNSVVRKRQRGCDARFILDVYVFDAEQLSECIADGALLKSVQTTQDPSGFK